MRIKQILFFVLFGWFFHHAKSQNAVLLWSHSFGNSFNNSLKEIAIDADGNVYKIGQFTNNAYLDFNPGVPDTTTAISSTPSLQIYLQKFDANGNFLWFKEFGSDGDDYPVDVQVDVDGNVMVLGNFRSSSIDVDPNVSVALVNGTADGAMFYSKLSADGSFLYGGSIMGVLPGASATGAALSSSTDGVLISGQFSGWVDLNPGAGDLSLNSGDDMNLFLLKLNSNNDFVWAKRFCKSKNARINDMEQDGQGNIIIAGGFTDNASFDENESDSLISGEADPYYVDGFVAKYDTVGNYIWSYKIGNVGKSDIVHDVLINMDNSILLSGIFSGTVDVDFGAGTQTFSASNGLLDSYILKVDEDAQFVWFKHFISSAKSDAQGMGYDSEGNIYFGGKFETNLDLDDAGLTGNHTSNGQSDLYVASLSAAGNYRWSYAMGIGAEESLNDLVVNDDYLYFAGEATRIAGGINPTQSFDPDPNPNAATSLSTDEQYSAGKHSYLVKWLIGDSPNMSLLEFDNNNFEIYPNPATEYIRIENGGINPIKYNITDINGTLLRAGLYNNKIEIGDLPAGVYFIHLRVREISAIKKVIKQ